MCVVKQQFFVVSIMQMYFLLNHIVLHYSVICYLCYGCICQVI